MKNQIKNPQVNNIEKYSSGYSDESLMDTLSRMFRYMGRKLVYYVCLLYLVMKSPYTPWKTKGLIAGALGYVILPTDLIPDFLPVVGFSDDLSAVIYVVNAVGAHITPQIEQEARSKAEEIFGSGDGTLLAE